MIKSFKVLQYLLSILFLVFLTLAVLPNHSISYNSWVRKILDKEFYQVYDIEDLGKIYHSKTFYMPDDSLVEYYWDGKYILVGTNKISKANKEKYLQNLSEMTKISVVMILSPDFSKEDTLFIARTLDIKDFEIVEDKIVSRVFLNNYEKIVYINGSDYTVEEAFKIGAWFLIDDARKHWSEFLSTLFIIHPSE